MSMWPCIGLLGTVLATSVGQLMFKMAAERANTAHSLFASDVLIALSTALTLCVIATLIWIWVLRYVPLTIANVFTSLSFVIVPILSSLFLHEPFNLRLALGFSLIVSGVFVSISGKEL